MNYLQIIACVLVLPTMGEGLHQSFFDGLQEIENVHISHKLIHRTRRRVSLGHTAMPDIILTEIKGDNHHSYLKFQRNRKKALSPLFTLDKNMKLVKRKTTALCTHFYEDTRNSAHAMIDSCNGVRLVKMTAEVALNNEIYMIIPKRSEKMEDDLQHGLFKVNTTRNYTRDYSLSTKSNKENSLPNVNHRFRRQTERNYVELMFVIDYSLYSFWYGLTNGTDAEREVAALDLIQKMYAFIGNGVRLRYEGLQTTYGISIDVELSSVYVIKTAEEEADMTQAAVDFTFSPRGTVDAVTLLDDFKAWIAQQRVSNFANFENDDHFMLLTAREIVLSGNADAAGYAFYSKVCTSESMSIVEDKFDFISIVTAAHELGHSLGGLHDGEAGDGNCRDEDGYILSAINEVYINSKATHPWKFSPCSAAAFSSKLASLQASTNNCLRRDDAQPVLLPTGKPPGQLFPPDRQCQLMLDSESVMWRQIHYGAFDRMCTAMACTQLGLTKITFVLPADGTTCGDKKWCWNGHCVYSDDAPSADDVCLHGDQTGAFLSGTTCAETLADNRTWRCYQANIEQSCCGTCATGVTGVEGCKYGDGSDCSSVRSSQCYDENISTSSCCKTCHDFAQPYTTLPADCKYGDRKAGCINSVSTCTRFLSDCCATCAGFTMPAKSSTTTSMTSSVTSPVSSETTKGTTQTTQKPTTAVPVEAEGLPEWVLPVAAGVGGVIALSFLIWLCSYCLKKKSKDKYRDEKDRRPSGDRRRNSGENRRTSVDRNDRNRRRSEDYRGNGRRVSEDHRSDDRNRRRSEDNRSDGRRASEDIRRDGRRASEDVRGGHNNRRFSTPNGGLRY